MALSNSLGYCETESGSFDTGRCGAKKTFKYPQLGTFRKTGPGIENLNLATPAAMLDEHIDLSTARRVAHSILDQVGKKDSKFF